MTKKSKSGSKSHYACQNCGTQSAKWQGRCPACGEWNTFVEEVEQPEAPTRGAAAVWNTGESPARPVSLAETSVEGPSSGRRPGARLETGISELDRVLGGGLVPDSFVLLGGDPGIGKSTLVLQLAQALAQKFSSSSEKILYVSGEESVDQIRSRASRMGVKAGNIYLASETIFENVLAEVEELKPRVLIVDSVQTFMTRQLESAPGSVGQVREVAARLMGLAKGRGINVWLIGHVTKDGTIAGPKVVEHMVDTVLYFEGDVGLNYRMLRAIKNRFGSVRELGVFEMREEGLAEVKNPSALFLSERTEPVGGVAVGSCLEGTRPLLVEVQALVARTVLPMPKRNAVGLDHARLGLLAAVLERHMGLELYDRDLFVNVAGGFKISETGADLACAAAVWSAFCGAAIPGHVLFLGELGLTGEVRSVAQMDLRAEEAKKLGFTTVVVPRSALERLKSVKGLTLVPVNRVGELPQALHDFGVEISSVKRSPVRRPDATV